MKLSLITGHNWEYAYTTDEELRKTNVSPFTIAEINGLYDTFTATLPGCFELNLFKSGLAPDPYFSDNIYLFRKYECCHQWYFSAFDSERETGVLHFNCIDTVADVIVNGKIVCHTDNMFIPHECEINGLKKSGNEIIVHVYPNEIAARAYYSPAMCFAQKYSYPALGLRRSPAYYGWDIFPRLACGGILGDIFLTDKKDEKFNEFYLYTANINGDGARINLFYDFSATSATFDYKITVSGKCGESEFFCEFVPWHTNETASFYVSNPLLWFPRGYGKPDLYDVEIKLFKKGKETDKKVLRFGIRTVQLSRTALASDDNSKFEFEINGKKVFVLGSNWVPVDALHEHYDEKVRDNLRSVIDIGCNAVRVWGGGLYETDSFYDYCDENGIMVWQDFMMACGKYPESDDFLRRIAAETETAVKRLRNHCSVITWAGDNECDLAHSWNGFKFQPLSYSVTRDVIPRMLRDHDMLRPYLPSSPYVENQAAAENPEIVSEYHIWGPRDYFKSDYYKNASALFVSETGYHGCPSPQSLKKFLKNYEIMFEGGTPTREYLAHATSSGGAADEPFAYRINLMREQAKTLFPGVENISDFITASQISQAEADKFFIERMRIKRNNCGGIIWWNIADGWPQVSDAVIDFYGVKKLAYDYIKRSQASVCIMGDEKDGVLSLYLVNDTENSVKIEYSVKNLYSAKEVLKETATCDAFYSQKITEITLPVGDKSFYLFTWTYDGKKASNHFHTGVISLSLEKYLKALESAGFDEWEGF